MVNIASFYSVLCRHHLLVLSEHILIMLFSVFFFFQAEDGIRDADVTGVQTCALPISAFCTEVHRERGVEIITGASVVDIAVAGGSAREVVLADGRRLPCDLLVVGVGLVPNTELAEKRSEERRVGKECRSRWSPYH